MKTRRNKTVSQQCRYYEVENIYDYMVERYLISDFDGFRGLFKELCPDARRLFIDYIFDEVPRVYHQEIIRATI